MNSRLRAFTIICLMAVTGYMFVRTTAQERRNPVTPGKQPNGSVLVTTNQAVTPIGIVHYTEGARPKDVALSPDGKTLAVLTNKQNQAVLLYAAQTGEIEAAVGIEKLTTDALGLAWSPNGNHLYASCQKGAIVRITNDGGTWKQDAVFQINGANGDPQLLGWLCLQTDRVSMSPWAGATQLACSLSPDGKLRQTVPVGVAPYRILLSHDGNTLYAANRGGHKVGEDVTSAENSGGTRVEVDPETDAALHGSISIIDVSRAEATAQEVSSGRQPCGMVLARDDKTLYVANSDSDTVDIFDTARNVITKSIRLTPPEDAGFGQIPTSLALSDDQKMLYVACGGENAVALVSLGSSPRITGYLPTGWFPIALAQRVSRALYRQL